MNQFRRIAVAVTLGAGLLGAMTAHAADERQVRTWAATCSTCHGTQGTSSSVMPSIAGQDEAKLLTMLKEFKDGSRPATVMHQHAKGYTDEELALLAAYFARQRP